MNKIKLVSDFRDYYDLWFDREGEPFTRNMRDGLSRPDAFRRMRDMGLKTPEHNVPGLLNSSLVVVHTDLFAHCAQGKLLMSREVADRHYPNDFAVEFVASDAGSQVWRYLSVGSQAFWIGYKSDDLWRSNVGNVAMRALPDAKPPKGMIPWDGCPIWAIDFVGDNYAIDFNGSPGMSGTGMENLLRPREVVNLIREWFNKKNGAA